MSERGRDALPNVWEWSGGPPRYPGVVERTSRMSRSGRETLPNVRECWEALTNVQKACRMSDSVWKALPDVREALLDVRERSRGPPGCPELVVTPFQMSGSGLEAIPDVREWS